MDDSSEDADCCGSGCNPCILDVRKKKTYSEDLTSSLNILDQSNYVKFIINDINKIAEEYLIFKFILKDDSENDKRVILKIGQYIILCVSNVSRSFTPILWNNTSFTILVKIYNNGQMSQLLKKQQINDEVEVRGPYGEFLYRQNSYKKIIMFCVGSGIAAMYSIINSIISNESEDTQIHLYASFRYFALIPFKEELRRLTDYWNFSCSIFLTQEKRENVLSGINLKYTRLCTDLITQILENNAINTTMILICGTKEFNLMTKETAQKCNFTNYHIFE